jgi:hypothetical protein
MNPFRSGISIFLWTHPQPLPAGREGSYGLQDFTCMVTDNVLFLMKMVLLILRKNGTF